jgi:translation elongation factor P/translation initiation factor 5A
MVRASDLKAGMVLPLEKNLYKIFHVEYHSIIPLLN